MVVIANEIAAQLINRKIYVQGNKMYTSQAQIEQDKMKHHPFCNIYSPLQFDMVNQWHQLVPENIEYRAQVIQNSLNKYSHLH